jgi:prevent-host-death family protein
MIMVNIADAKARLSEFVEAAARGEQVLICNRNRPVAELRAVPASTRGARDLTAVFPDWNIDSAFFEPLSDKELAAWRVESDEPLKVAEGRASYGKRKTGSRRGK